MLSCLLHLLCKCFLCMSCCLWVFLSYFLLGDACDCVALTWCNFSVLGLCAYPWLCSHECDFGVFHDALAPVCSGFKGYKRDLFMSLLGDNKKGWFVWNLFEKQSIPSVMRETSAKDLHCHTFFLWRKCELHIACMQNGFFPASLSGWMR